MRVKNEHCFYSFFCETTVSDVIILLLSLLFFLLCPLFLLFFSLFIFLLQSSPLSHCCCCLTVRATCGFLRTQCSLQASCLVSAICQHSASQSAARDLTAFVFVCVCMCMCKESSFQPKVTFPRSLLGSAYHTNLSSVTAYLTVPQRHVMKDCSHYLPAFIPSRSGEQRLYEE